jgi:hypothetical protein
MRHGKPEKKGRMGKMEGKLRRDEETKNEEMGEGRKDGKSKGRDKRKRDWSKLKRVQGKETGKSLEMLGSEGRD